MKTASNLSELLVDNLKKIYTSEKLQLTALADLKQKANSGALRGTIAAYEKTKAQNIARVKECFELLHVAADKHQCPVTQTLIDDCQSNISHAAEPHVADAALISTIQAINHFNIANYGTVASFSKTLDKDDVASKLHEALLDEKTTDEKLSGIAEENINPSAVLMG